MVFRAFAPGRASLVGADGGVCPLSTVPGAKGQPPWRKRTSRGAGV
eukprot:CAMPEP_0198547084 /NCGR_PEP_ID=MMETSP1462-20131121/67362_1 /TAXON_ID=1333877 /ORGANISM="Brandtodinium nutriculum, Strain RCC3387" /LENGTH=45 /DNA_ID= /DNA_START= /DNA_END= /DNA_ORIENTATION=